MAQISEETLKQIGETHANTLWLKENQRQWVNVVKDQGEDIASLKFTRAWGRSVLHLIWGITVIAVCWHHPQLAEHLGGIPT